MLFPPPRLFFSPGARPGPCQGLRPWTPLGALPPPQFAKVVARRRQGGISGFPAECAGPPLIGSGGLGLFVTRRGGKGWWMDRLGRRKFQRTGGGRRLGAKRPERANPGPLAPGSLFCLAAGGAARRAAPRPAKRRRPRRDPGASANAKKATQKPGLAACPVTSRPPLGYANLYADSIVFSGEFPYSRR